MNRKPRNTVQWNLNQNVNIFFQQNVPKLAVCLNRHICSGVHISNVWLVSRDRSRTTKLYYSCCSISAFCMQRKTLLTLPISKYILSYELFVVQTFIKNMDCQFMRTPWEITAALFFAEFVSQSSKYHAFTYQIYWYRKSNWYHNGHLLHEIYFHHSDTDPQLNIISLQWYPLVCDPLWGKSW